MDALVLRPGPIASDLWSFAVGESLIQVNASTAAGHPMAVSSAP